MATKAFKLQLKEELAVSGLMSLNNNANNKGVSEILANSNNKGVSEIFANSNNKGVSDIFANANNKGVSEIFASKPFFFPLSNVNFHKDRLLNTPRVDHRSCKETIANLKRDLQAKDALIQMLHAQIRKQQDVIKSYNFKVKSVVHLLNQPVEGEDEGLFEVPALPELTVYPDTATVHDLQLKDEMDEVRSNGSSEPESGLKRKKLSSDSSTRITDRQNRRWAHEENVMILKYVLDTIQRGGKIEKPNAPKYYTKMMEECKLSPDINHNLLRNKVQNFRRAYEKAKKDNTECSYREYLEAIWGDKSADKSFDELVSTKVEILDVNSDTKGWRDHCEDAFKATRLKPNNYQQPSIESLEIKPSLSEHSRNLQSLTA